MDNSNLVELIVAVNRVSKTVKGGRTFSFSAIVVVGSKQGQVGFGIGKANEVNEAKEKALKKAKKSLIKIPLKEGRTIHHDVIGEFGAVKVVIRSAPSGTGVIAGDRVGAVLRCLGVQDAVTKTLGSTNPYNIVAATFDALSKINSPKFVADRRGKAISEIIQRRNIAKEKKVNHNEEE